MVLVYHSLLERERGSWSKWDDQSLMRIRKVWLLREAEFSRDLKGLRTGFGRKEKARFGVSGWRRKWQPTPVFLLGKSHGAWRATIHGVTESDMTEQPTTHRKGYREGLRQWFRGWEERYNAGEGVLNPNMIRISRLSLLGLSCLQLCFQRRKLHQEGNSSRLV